ncbi:dehydrin6 [Zea mays]|uniref:Dehydrin6 n=1 Tax=Zea mays TaxID=4577 RepID=A0A1D6ND67_MAIZE|nr:dehydrin6 [Zea mays]
MADHKEEPVPESVMDKITEKFHGGDSSSSSSDSDDEKKGSSLASAAEAMKAKIYRLFGRERPVHSVLGGGKPIAVSGGSLSSPLNPNTRCSISTWERIWNV